MKAVVKAMGEAEVQGDAIRKSCDQPCVPRMPPVTAARPGTTSEGRGTHEVEDKGILCKRLERSIAFRVSIGLE